MGEKGNKLLLDLDLGELRTLWGNTRLGRREASPLEALVSIVDEGERGDDQLAGHAAELPAESLHVLADALVPGANDTE